MTARQTVAGAGVAAAAAGAATLVMAARRWERRTRDVNDRLARAGGIHHDVYSERELDALPPVVQRYFRAALVDGQPIVRHAHVVQRGTFNMGTPAAHAWKPFTAVQDFYPLAPGFVWNARVRLLPGVNAFVRDAFADGEGSMRAAAFGLFTVADAHGTPEVASAALVRYLAEMPWVPTALLPSQGVRWSVVSDSSARATLNAGQTTASLVFHFGRDGLPTGCETLRDHDTLKTKMPWGGTYVGQIERSGMKVPGRAEVFWRLPSGYFPYWRGTIEPTYETVPSRSP